VWLFNGEYNNMNNFQQWLENKAYKTETPTDGVWKFVRVNGEYRWINGMRNHSDVMEKGEIAETAGTVFIFQSQKRAYMESGYSTTLKVSADDEDYKELRKLFEAIGYTWSDYNY